MGTKLRLEEARNVSVFFAHQNGELTGSRGQTEG
jgi:hypothetical protein